MRGRLDAAAVLFVTGALCSAIAIGVGTEAAAKAAGPAARMRAAPGAKPSGESSTPGRANLPEAIRQVLFRDLDGDGREDLIVAYGEKTGCLLGRAVLSGGSLAVEPLALAGNPRLEAPLVGDADGDGTDDILSVDPDGVLMRRGLGGGRFDATPRRLVQADDLLFPAGGCAAAARYLLDVDGDARPELVLPVLGGVRIVHLSAGAAPAPGPVELFSEPCIGGGEEGLSFSSALPTFLGAGASQVAILGPLVQQGVPRLDFSWWTRERDGSLAAHRTALAVPAGESAAMAFPFDLEGDGRPEVALLTMPSRISKLLGEYALRVYRASDRADAPVQPFFAGTTDINYWQFPSLASRQVPGGSDLLIAFYRGLRTAHLNIEIFRSDGAGSFQAKRHDVELISDKEAKREFLSWTDVDGDGTLDLVAADNDGLRIHRGVASRDRPVEEDATWTSPIVPEVSGVSVNVDAGGALTISLGPPGTLVFRDLDHDGALEAISFKNDLTGGHELAIEKLKPAAGRSR